MTEQEWLSCSKLSTALEFLRNKISQRKLRLFAVACCRYLGGAMMNEPQCRNAVEMAEQYADGDVSLETLRAVSLDDSKANPGFRKLDIETARYVIEPDAFEAALKGAESSRELGDEVDASDLDSRHPQWINCVNERIKRQELLLRDIVGNPFRSSLFEPQWFNPKLVELAFDIYKDRRFNRLPYLADVLEKTGCDNSIILNHCRDNNPHARGCWVVDKILCKK